MQIHPFADNSQMLVGSCLWRLHTALHKGFGFQGLGFRVALPAKLPVSGFRRVFKPWRKIGALALGRMEMGWRKHGPVVERTCF